MLLGFLNCVWIGKLGSEWRKGTGFAAEHIEPEQSTVKCFTGSVAGQSMRLSCFRDRWRFFESPMCKVSRKR